MALPLAGIDLSTSAVKAVCLSQGTQGLTLDKYVETQLPTGAFADGEIVDQDAVVEAITIATETVGISEANIALPESKSYLFTTDVSSKEKAGQRVEIEQHIEEFVPLPPQETVFDFTEVGTNKHGGIRVEGIGFARRIIEETLKVFDKADIGVRAMESESFVSTRALLHLGDESTVLIVDIGKTTTKIIIATNRTPIFATTVNIGGHALTLAVQKYFSVTEDEARVVKAKKGIIQTGENKEYISTMLSTLSVIREEVSRNLEYWQERAMSDGLRAPVTHALIVGGNASVRGLPEYFEGALRIPVSAGNVFTNLASRDVWIPELDYTESLAYATAIGLALRDKTSYA